MKYFISTQVINGSNVSTVIHGKTEKILSSLEAYRLVPEEIQEESMDQAIEIDQRFAELLLGYRKTLRVKKIVINRGLETKQ